MIREDFNYISFGTLYELLVREGFLVTGDIWHFSVTDKSGQKFEFSYDYVGVNGEYYYFKNKEKCNIHSNKPSISLKFINSTLNNKVF